MGFLDIFKPQASPPVVPSVLPDAAKREILCGLLPTLQPNNLFLKGNEICHYADRAIFEKRTVSKRRTRRNVGYSVPGLFKGTRVHFGRGGTEYEDDVKYSTIKGILYITNKRIIFVSDHDGFDKDVSEVIAVTPYSNCVEIQLSKETLKLFVPDGGLPQAVLRMIL